MKPYSTWILLLVFVVLSLYVFYFERAPLSLPAPGPQDYILRLVAADVVKLRLSSGTRKLSLQREPSGHWYSEAAPAQSLDPSRIQSLLTQISAWPVSKVLEPLLAPARYKEFGLAPPALVLQLETATARYQVKIGNQTPIHSGYYVLTPDQRQLVLSYVNIPEVLEQLLNHPPLIATKKP